LKFYICIYESVLHATAKRNVISVKNDKVIDFLTT